MVLNLVKGIAGRRVAVDLLAIRASKGHHWEQFCDVIAPQLPRARILHNRRAASRRD
jgi:hypothetical protein